MGLSCSSPKEKTVAKRSSYVHDTSTLTPRFWIKSLLFAITQASPCTAGLVGLQWWPLDPGALCQSDTKNTRILGFSTDLSLLPVAVFTMSAAFFSRDKSMFCYHAGRKSGRLKNRHCRKQDVWDWDCRRSGMTGFKRMRCFPRVPSLITEPSCHFIRDLSQLAWISRWYF